MNEKKTTRLSERAEARMKRKQEIRAKQRETLSIQLAQVETLARDNENLSKELTAFRMILHPIYRELFAYAYMAGARFNDARKIDGLFVTWADDARKKLAREAEGKKDYGNRTSAKRFR